MGKRKYGRLNEASEELVGGNTVGSFDEVGKALLALKDHYPPVYVSCGAKVAQLLPSSSSSGCQLYTLCLCRTCSKGKAHQWQAVDSLDNWVEKHCEAMDLPADESADDILRDVVMAGRDINGIEDTLGNFMRQAASVYGGPSLIGKDVFIYWEGDGLWFPGQVRGYDEQTGEHLVRYPDEPNKEYRIYLPSASIHFGSVQPGEDIPIDPLPAGPSGTRVGPSPPTSDKAPLLEQIRAMTDLDPDQAPLPDDLMGVAGDEVAQQDGPKEDAMHVEAGESLPTAVSPKRSVLLATVHPQPTSLDNMCSPVAPEEFSPETDASAAIFPPAAEATGSPSKKQKTSWEMSGGQQGALSGLGTQAPGEPVADIPVVVVDSYTHNHQEELGGPGGTHPASEPPDKDFADGGHSPANMEHVNLPCDSSISAPASESPSDQDAEHQPTAGQQQEKKSSCERSPSPPPSGNQGGEALESGGSYVKVIGRKRAFANSALWDAVAASARAGGAASFEAADDVRIREVPGGVDDTDEPVIDAAMPSQQQGEDPTARAVSVQELDSVQEDKNPKVAGQVASGGVTEETQGGEACWGSEAGRKLQEVLLEPFWKQQSETSLLKLCSSMTSGLASAAYLQFSLGSLGLAFTEGVKPKDFQRLWTWLDTGGNCEDYEEHIEQYSAGQYGRWHTSSQGWRYETAYRMPSSRLCYLETLKRYGVQAAVCTKEEKNPIGAPKKRWYHKCRSLELGTWSLVLIKSWLSKKDATKDRAPRHSVRLESRRGLRQDVPWVQQAAQVSQQQVEYGLGLCHQLVAMLEVGEELEINEGTAEINLGEWLLAAKSVPVVGGIPGAPRQPPSVLKSAVSPVDMRDLQNLPLASTGAPQGDPEYGNLGDDRKIVNEPPQYPSPCAAPHGGLGDTIVPGQGCTLQAHSQTKASGSKRIPIDGECQKSGGHLESGAPHTSYMLAELLAVRPREKKCLGKADLMRRTLMGGGTRGRGGPGTSHCRGPLAPQVSSPNPLHKRYLVHPRGQGGQPHKGHSRLEAVVHHLRQAFKHQHTTQRRVGPPAEPSRSPSRANTRPSANLDDPGPRSGVELHPRADHNVVIGLGSGEEGPGTNRGEGPGPGALPEAAKGADVGSNASDQPKSLSGLDAIHLPDNELENLLDLAMADLDRSSPDVDTAAGGPMSCPTASAPVEQELLSGAQTGSLVVEGEAEGCGGKDRKPDAGDNDNRPSEAMGVDHNDPHKASLQVVDLLDDADDGVPLVGQTNGAPTPDEREVGAEIQSEDQDLSNLGLAGGQVAGVGKEVPGGEVGENEQDESQWDEWQLDADEQAFALLLLGAGQSGLTREFWRIVKCAFSGPPVGGSLGCKLERAAYEEGLLVELDILLHEAKKFWRGAKPIKELYLARVLARHNLLGEREEEPLVQGLLETTTQKEPEGGGGVELSHRSALAGTGQGLPHDVNRGSGSENGDPQLLVQIAAGGGGGGGGAAAAPNNSNNNDNNNYYNSNSNGDDGSGGGDGQQVTVQVAAAPHSAPIRGSPVTSPQLPARSRPLPQVGSPPNLPGRVPLASGTSKNTFETSVDHLKQVLRAHFQSLDKMVVQEKITQVMRNHTKRRLQQVLGGWESLFSAVRDGRLSPSEGCKWIMKRLQALHAVMVSVDPSRATKKALPGNAGGPPGTSDLRVLPATGTLQVTPRAGSIATTAPAVALRAFPAGQPATLTLHGGTSKSERPVDALQPSLLPGRARGSQRPVGVEQGSAGYPRGQGITEDAANVSSIRGAPSHYPNHLASPSDPILDPQPPSFLASTSPTLTPFGYNALGPSMSMGGNPSGTYPYNSLWPWLNTACSFTAQPSAAFEYPGMPTDPTHTWAPFRPPQPSLQRSSVHLQRTQTSAKGNPQLGTVHTSPHGVPYEIVGEFHDNTSTTEQQEARYQHQGPQEGQKPSRTRMGNAGQAPDALPHVTPPHMQPLRSCDVPPSSQCAWQSRLQSAAGAHGPAGNLGVSTCRVPDVGRQHTGHGGMQSALQLHGAKYGSMQTLGQMIQPQSSAPDVGYQQGASTVGGGTYGYADDLMVQMGLGSGGRGEPSNISQAWGGLQQEQQSVPWQSDAADMSGPGAAGYLPAGLPRQGAFVPEPPPRIQPDEHTSQGFNIGMHSRISLHSSDPVRASSGYQVVRNNRLGEAFVQVGACDQTRTRITASEHMKEFSVNPQEGQSHPSASRGGPEVDAAPICTSLARQPDGHEPGPSPPHETSRLSEPCTGLSSTAVLQDADTGVGEVSALVVERAHKCEELEQIFSVVLRSPEGCQEIMGVLGKWGDDLLTNVHGDLYEAWKRLDLGYIEDWVRSGAWRKV